MNSTYMSERGKRVKKGLEPPKFVLQTNKRPVLSATKIMTWKCHVDDSTAGRYDMIIHRDQLTKLGKVLKFSTDTIYRVRRRTVPGMYNWDGKSK